MSPFMALASCLRVQLHDSWSDDVRQSHSELLREVERVEASLFGYVYKITFCSAGLLSGMRDPRGSAVVDCFRLDWLRELIVSVRRCERLVVDGNNAGASSGGVFLWKRFRP